MATRQQGRYICGRQPKDEFIHLVVQVGIGETHDGFVDDDVNRGRLIGIFSGKLISRDNGSLDLRHVAETSLGALVRDSEFTVPICRLVDGSGFTGGDSVMISRDSVKGQRNRGCQHLLLTFCPEGQCPEGLYGIVPDGTVKHPKERASRLKSNPAHA